MSVVLYILGWFTCLMVLIELESVITKEKLTKARIVEIAIVSLGWPLVGFIYLAFQRIK